MKKILFRNVNIATMNSHTDTAFGAIRNTFIRVEDGQVFEIGSADTDDISNRPTDEVIDGEGCWVLPGFIDCHTHAVYGGHRAGEFQKRMSGISYEAIAKEGGGIWNTVEATRKASHETLYREAKKRLLRLLSEGVTTVEVKSGYGLDEASEFKMLEVIQQLERELPQKIIATCLAAHTLPKEFHGQSDAYIDWVACDFLPKVSQRKLATQCDVFIESVGFTREQANRVLTAAKSLGLAVKGHVEQLSNLQGSRLIAKLNGLSADHVEYLEEEDIAYLKQQGTTPVLLPLAFYFLRESHKPPVEALRKSGVEFAIGTDLNPGSAPGASLLLALNMAAVLFGCTVEECLKGATRAAANALGVQAERGQLAPGMAADFSLWAIETPAELVYGMNLYSPKAVYINGELVHASTC